MDMTQNQDTDLTSQSQIRNFCRQFNLAVHKAMQSVVMLVAIPMLL